eukprot:4191964-Prymnesium_polylepis.1
MDMPASRLTSAPPSSKHRTKGPCVGTISTASCVVPPPYSIGTGSWARAEAFSDAEKRLGSLAVGSWWLIGS